MSEATTQRRYSDLIVLVEGARVLESSFPTIGLVLTGSELEILRNMMNYATRRTTYVEAYHDSYYLAVTDDDWLDIETIVSVLEGKLMGNENTLWGYNESLYLRQASTVSGTTVFDQRHTTVPEGEVWIVTGVTWLSLMAGGSVNIQVKSAAIDYPVTKTQTWTVDEWSGESGLYLVLKEGDLVEFAFYDLAEGQHVKSNVNGYKMKVEV